MADDWRLFGRELSEELFNKAFATAKLNCEIDLLTTGGNDWQTGGSSVAQTFVGGAIRTDFNKFQFADTNAETVDITVKVKASEVPFKIRKDNQVMRVQEKNSLTGDDLGLVSYDILDAKIDAVDAVWTVIGSRK